MRNLNTILLLLFITTQAQAGILDRLPVKVVNRCSNFVMGVLDERLSPHTRLKVSTLAMSGEEYAQKRAAFQEKWNLLEGESVHVVKLTEKQALPENFKELISLSNELQLQKSQANMAEVIGISANVDDVRIQFGGNFPNDYNSTQARAFVQAVQEGEGRIVVVVDAARGVEVNGKLVNIPNYRATHYPADGVRVFDMELGIALSPQDYIVHIKNRRQVTSLLGNIKNLQSLAWNLLDTQRYTQIVAQGTEIIHRHQKFWDSWKNLFTKPSYDGFVDAFKQSKVLMEDTETFVHTTRTSLAYLNQMPLPLVPTAHRGTVRAEIQKRVSAYSVILEDIELMNKGLGKFNDYAASGMERIGPVVEFGVQKGQEITKLVSNRYTQVKALKQSVDNQIAKARSLIGMPKQLVESAKETIAESFYTQKFYQTMATNHGLDRQAFFQELAARERSVLHVKTQYLLAHQWVWGIEAKLAQKVMVYQKGHHPITNPFIEFLLMAEERMTLVDFFAVWKSGSAQERGELFHKLYLAVGDEGQLRVNSQEVLRLAEKSPELQRAMNEFYRHWFLMGEYERRMFLLSLLPN